MMNSRFLIFIAFLALTVTVPAECAYQQVILRQRPAAYYRFDDAVLPGGDALKSLGSIQITNTVYYPARRSSVEGAVQGDAGAWFENGGTRAVGQRWLDPWPVFSIELWAMRAEGGSVSRAMAGSYSLGEKGYRGWMLRSVPGTPGGWSFCIGGGENGVGEVVTGKAAAGEWTHLAGTYDGALMQLYVNGELAGIQVFYGGVVNPKAREMGLGLGERGDGGFPWSGGLDEVALYDTVLSASAVAQHYELSTNSARYEKEVLKSKPLAYWRMNEPVPNKTAVNSAPYSVTGVRGEYLLGAAPSAEGPRYVGFEAYNRGLSLTNSMDHVSLSWGSALTASDSWSFTGWVKPSVKHHLGDPIKRVLFANGSASGPDRFSLYCWQDNDLAYCWGSEEEILLPARVSEGAWSYMAFVVKPEEAILWMNDGTNSFLTAVTNRMTHKPLAPGANGAEFCLGADTGGLLEKIATNFRGEMDEWAVFDRALSEEEVQQQFRAAWYAELPPAPSEPPTLRYQWKDGVLILTWTGGILCEFDHPGGALTSVPGAVSPRKIVPSGRQSFYVVVSD